MVAALLQSGMYTVGDVGAVQGQEDEMGEDSSAVASRSGEALRQVDSSSARSTSGQSASRQLHMAPLD